MSAGPDPPYVTTTGAHPEPNGSETVGATCSIPLNDSGWTFRFGHGFRGGVGGGKNLLDRQP